MVSRSKILPIAEIVTIEIIDDDRYCMRRYNTGTGIYPERTRLNQDSIVGASPDISRVRGVHLQGIQGRRCSCLPQVPDNAVNGRLGLARRVKNFEH